MEPVNSQAAINSSGASTGDSSVRSTLKARLIPVILLRDGRIVQSKGFQRYQVLGNPTAMVERLADWVADELIYLDLTGSAVHAPGRQDLAAPASTDILQILAEVARVCFMPLTFGGGIRTLSDIEARLRAGADKVTLNTQALATPALITEAAREFGSQAVVVSIDAKACDGPAGARAWQCRGGGGRVPAVWTPAGWAREAEQRGAGEILINSIDRDGSGRGYDLDLVRTVVEAVSIPVIACGGVGTWEHLVEGLAAGASAVAAANIFHYSENSVYRARQHLFERGCPVRPPAFASASASTAASFSPEKFP